MGYDLHIVRKNNWDDFDEETNITLNEWLYYVENDGELELTNSNGTTPAEEQSFQNKPGYFEWNAHPVYKEKNARPWFEYWRGRISTKNPDDQIVLKMLAIAEKLNAKVQGDDGEFYDENEVSKIIHINNHQYDSLNPVKKKVWWKFWQ